MILMISPRPRSIPTCVGNTYLPANLPVGLDSSPRTRGVRCVRYAKDELLTIHPHARGECGLSGLNAVRRGRFIPTHVRSTKERSLQSDCCTDPSPHTWGVQRHSAQLRPRIRFIPTHVGSTGVHRYLSRLAADSSPHT